MQLGLFISQKGWRFDWSLSNDAHPESIKPDSKFKSVRYADDLVVLAPDVESAQQALEELKSWAGEAGFTLHPEKTRVVDMGESRAHFDFLGYRFLRTAKGEIIRLVRPKSKKELRESLKPILKRANGRSLEHLIRIINPKFRGWYAYFMQAQPNEHQEMDQWVRMRLRSILRKRHKGTPRKRV
ncbi:MAG: group II intron maturase-specific domain-containing protein [Verrucomicrobiales bacterium]